MKNIAFLFPGQGAQSAGMGHDLYQEYDLAREIFDMTDDLTRRHISRLCFKGPMEDLTMTVNLQPAVTAVNLAFLNVILKEGLRPAAAAGHSLGEYSALAAAGAVAMDDAVRMVFRRGELMHRESLKSRGEMHAIVGLPIDAVEEIVAEAGAGGPVSVANHNTETQIVITGYPEPVRKASALAAERGAKSIPLKVSGAWHSPLMKGAEADFEEFLSTMAFRAPACGVIHNVAADAADDPEEIKTLMVRQLCSPVRWYDSMKKLEEAQTEIFVEIGPGKVLTGLLKKILPKGHACGVYNVNNLKTLEAFMSAAV